MASRTVLVSTRSAAPARRVDEGARATADAIALVAESEAWRRIRPRRQPRQQVERRLVTDVESVFRRERRSKNRLEPERRAGPIEPVGHRQPIQRLGVRRRLVSDRSASDRLQVGLIARGHGPERIGDIGFAVAVEPDTIDFRREARIRVGQIVERQREFVEERADTRVSAVDQLAAEFRDLSTRERAPERAAPAADFLVRIDHQHRDARLAQAVRSRQTSEARADDDHLGFELT